MPILPENKSRYPTDWKIRVRFVREIRARNRCERCGVPRHAVGYRESNGSFVPNCGNGPCDAAGRGYSWPGYLPLSYKEAAEFCEVYNCCVMGNRRCDDDGNHWFVVVLTVAHLYDDRPEASSLLNLAALCQRCHNRLDAAARRRRRMARLDAQQKFLFAEADHS